jgi:hypothetical protein
MRPKILPLGFGYKRDQFRREVKHPIGVEIGIAWTDSELRLGVPRRGRRAAVILIPITACQCSYYRPGRTHAAPGEQLQELWHGLASALKVFPVAVVIQAQAVVHAPAQLEI